MTLDTGPKPRTSPGELTVAPPPENWDDRIEHRALDHGRRRLLNRGAVPVKG